MSIDKQAPRKWHKGPPPHVGWWNASAAQALHCWRWWNGSVWSRGVFFDSSAAYAAKLARNVFESQAEVEWTDQYPDNARVPRVNPRNPNHAPIIWSMEAGDVKQAWAWYRYNYGPHTPPRRESALVWVAVGTNSVDAPSTWFYAFPSSEEANKFIAQAKAVDPTIMWDAYPCEVDSAATAFEAFTEAMAAP